MKFFSKISPEWSLRLGFGIMYLYSGSDLIRHPTAWYWALPLWFKNLITSAVSLETYLRFQGIIEIVFAIVLLGWFFKTAIVKIVALLSVLEMAGILAFAFLPWNEANFLITFRDIGLLGGAVALLAILSKRER
ncbi:MAG: hypothetical protein HYT13_03270 [Candidatus Liptonbacteria bacterium]|nr:hypothetical protein [Candidatus Liptonbacteria bacterium]